MTPFGAKLRELRAARQISLKEMAVALDVSSAYLSALEHGRRGKPPWMTVQRVIAYFNLIWDDAEELIALAACSDPRPILDTSGHTAHATEFANQLAVHFSELDHAAIEALQTALSDALARLQSTKLKGTDHV